MVDQVEAGVYDRQLEELSLDIMPCKHESRVSEFAKIPQNQHSFALRRQNTMGAGQKLLPKASRRDLTLEGMTGLLLTL